MGWVEIREEEEVKGEKKEEERKEREDEVGNIYEE